MKTKIHDIVIDEIPEKFINGKIYEMVEKVSPDKIPILEMYETIEGEGVYVGTPRTLVRVGGCAVGCSWCDTKHSWSLKNSNFYDLDLLVTDIIAASPRVREISITGGEPMHYPKQVMELSNKIKSMGFKTNMETSGMILSRSVFRAFDYIGLDIKTPSSGVELSDRTVALLISLAHEHPGIQLKAVVTGEDDLFFLEEYFIPVLQPVSPYVLPMVITPCADNTKKEVPPSSMMEVTNTVSEWNKRYHIKVISQQHKLLGYR